MSRARPVRAAAASIVAAALAAVPAGCGGSGGDSSARDRTAASNGVAAVGGQALIDAQEEYVRCMREQDVDLPRPGQAAEEDLAASGIFEAELREAEAGCERERRAIAEAAPKLSGADRRAAVEAGLRYARCMRERGQDVPDPSLSDESGGTSVEVPAGAKEDPAFQAATSECGRLLREQGLP